MFGEYFLIQPCIVITCFCIKITNLLRSSFQNQQNSNTLTSFKFFAQSMQFILQFPFSPLHVCYCFNKDLLFFVCHLFTRKSSKFRFAVQSFRRLRTRDICLKYLQVKGLQAHKMNNKTSSMIKPDFKSGNRNHRLNPIECSKKVQN